MKLFSECIHYTRRICEAEDNIQIKYWGINIWQFREGKIVEAWALEDMLYCSNSAWSLLPKKTRTKKNQAEGRELDEICI